MAGRTGQAELVPRLLGRKGGLGRGPRLEVGEDVAVILWIVGPDVRGRVSTRGR